MATGWDFVTVLWILKQQYMDIAFGLCAAGYLMQYFPSLGIAVMKKIGPGRAAQMKGGSSGYDVKSMLFKSKTGGKDE